MKSFLVLILSLTAGCEAFEVKGCKGGWVELTCKYPKDQEYQKIEVVKSSKTIINTTKKDAWGKDGNFSLYHDTRNKNLRMVIKHLKSEDSGKYNCKFYQRLNSSQEQELELKVGDCQTAFHQTAYETAETTLTCDFPGEYNSYVKFICKDNNGVCEEILSTQSSIKSNGTFTLTDTNSFNVSISNVNSQHAGVYWCGIKSKEGSAKGSLRKIRLKIKGVVRLIIMNIYIAVLLISVTLIYKRFLFPTNTSNEAASQSVKEDNVFEDVQENLLTNPSGSMHYAAVTFQSSSDKASSEVLIHKPSSSACEYSTVKNNQSSICPTVYEPSKISEDPVLQSTRQNSNEDDPGSSL